MRRMAEGLAMLSFLLLSLGVLYRLFFCVCLCYVDGMGDEMRDGKRPKAPYAVLYGG